MTESTRVGLLGLGTIGRKHARALHVLRDRAELRAFSGGTPEAAAEAGWPDAEQAPSHDLLARGDLDVVAICTPSDLHASQTLAALDGGRHVLVEKPLALTVSDAERIAARAAERGLHVSVVSQRRLEPEYAAVKRLLDRGELGTIRLATAHVHWWRDDAYYAASPWRSTAAAGGSALENQGVHNVDLLRWLAGPVDSVTAQAATLGHDIEAEDTTVATLRFDGGALGLVSVSTATPPGSQATLTLHLDRGVIELGQGEILCWDHDAPRPDTSGAAQDVASGAADPTAIGVDGHVQQWNDLFDAIRDGSPTLVSAADGALTVRLLNAIAAAARTGRAIRPKELT